MKKMLPIIAVLALIAGSAVAETTSAWKPARQATASEATVTVHDVGGGNYEVKIAVTTDPGIYGIASFAVELVGASSITNTAPMAGYLNPDYSPAPQAGFTLMRSGAGVAIVTGTQDTVDFLAPLVTHRHYGLGQAGGDLQMYAPVPPNIMNISVQPVYGAPLKIAEGSGLPTLGDETRVMIFVPEPATMSLLGLGGLIALLRRKR